MIAAIIQARVGSTRLPRKSLMDLAGRPMLAHVIERVRVSRVDAVVVATTQKSEDDAIESLAQKMGVATFRGSEADVLDRYYQCAKKIGASAIVRITGDCPLHDPEVIDLVLQRFQKMSVDYTCTPRNFPEGVDTEIFSFSALEVAHQEAALPSEREHVTLFIRNHPEKFRIDEPWVHGNEDNSNLHLSVDTKADFLLAQEIFRALGKGTTMFHVRDIVELFKTHPELREINKGGTGFEGLAKSLAEDEAWKKSKGV